MKHTFFSLFKKHTFFKKLLSIYVRGFPAFMVLLVLSGFAALIIPNCAGYCTWDGKLGRVPHKVQDGVIQTCIYPEQVQHWRRLTTEERRDIAINYYLCDREELVAYNKIREVEKLGSTDDVKKLFTLIPYGSKEEFLRENPDCCELLWGSVGKYDFGFWGRAKGIGNGAFNFRHKIRYMDREGIRKEVERTNLFIMVDNCGSPRFL